MRGWIMLGLSAGLLTLGTGPGQAFYEGPWCLKANMGRGHVAERCHFASFQACERERRFWGSSSFCIQSHRYLPNWYGRGIEPPPRVAKRKKPRRL